MDGRGCLWESGESGEIGEKIGSQRAGRRAPGRPRKRSAAGRVFWVGGVEGVGGQSGGDG